MPLCQALTLQAHAQHQRRSTCCLSLASTDQDSRRCWRVMGSEQRTAVLLSTPWMGMMYLVQLCCMHLPCSKLSFPFSADWLRSPIDAHSRRHEGTHVLLSPEWRR